MSKPPPHILDDVKDWKVGKFDPLDKWIEIHDSSGMIAKIDNDDVPNIGVSVKGFGHDVATLMAAAPSLRDMVKKLVDEINGEGRYSAHAEEATALLQRVEFTVVLPEDDDVSVETQAPEIDDLRNSLEPIIPWIRSVAGNMTPDSAIVASASRFATHPEEGVLTITAGQVRAIARALGLDRAKEDE